MELMKTKRLARSSATPGKLVGSIEPANWFSSLRTLHECALCPDIELYMSSWERLEDSCGNPHPPSSPHVSQFREPPNVDQSESRLQYSLVFGRDTRCQGQRAEFGVSNRSRGYIRPIQPNSPRRSPTDASPTPVLVPQLAADKAAKGSSIYCQILVTEDMLATLKSSAYESWCCGLVCALASCPRRAARAFTHFNV